MITFKKISYKNLLSVGAFPIVIDFEKTATTLITGKNGSGKSGLGEALVFALYGKPFRKINKGQLVNSINKKEALVELWFEIGEDKYLIRRGIKPNIFEIYKNDKLIDQEAAVRDYQAFLEEFIIKINYKSFTQIVFLGMATYVPFMELPAGARREIIEDLLDIKIFSKMNGLFKEDVSENKGEIKDTQHEIDLLDNSIKQMKSHNSEILALKNQNVDTIREKINTLLEEIKEIDADIVTKKEAISKFDTSGKAEVIKKLDMLKSLESEILVNLRNHRKEHQFFADNRVCPTCTQEISEEFKKKYEATMKSKIVNYVDGLEKLKGQIEKTSKMNEVFSEIETRKRGVESEISTAQSNRDWRIRQIKTNEAQLEEAKNISRSFKNDELVSAEEKVKLSREVFDKLTKTKAEYAIIAGVLKDTGFKSHTIKKYVQVINNLINKYLYDFGLYVDFYLDENFNETIRSRYRDDFSYASFSEGEKMRINLAIMFAWRSLSNSRNSMSSNLLILDETLDGVVDNDGIENLIRTLKTLNKDDNIFVISHRGDQLSDKFDRVLDFKKVNNFTVLNENTEED